MFREIDDSRQHQHQHQPAGVPDGESRHAMRIAASIESFSNFRAAPLSSAPSHRQRLVRSHPDADASVGVGRIGTQDGSARPTAERLRNGAERDKATVRSIRRETRSRSFVDAFPSTLLASAAPTTAFYPRPQRARLTRNRRARPLRHATARLASPLPCTPRASASASARPMHATLRHPDGPRHDAVAGTDTTI